MKRILMPIVALAVLTAACGGADTLSSSRAAQPVVLVGAQAIKAGANAASDTSDINQTNPVIARGRSPHLRPVPAASAVRQPGSPSAGSGNSRCSGTGPAGYRAGSTGQSGKTTPLLMCPVE
jgi:hypothetical protein